MTTASSPRQRLRALPGSGGSGLAVPLALELAARIQERDWEDFTCDPTQLANGLRDLLDAVSPDGLAVTTPQVLLESADPTSCAQALAAVEATRRLRASVSERAVLVACLPGPAALPGGGAALLELGKQFLAAGADAVVVLGDHGARSELSTLANVARFHQAIAMGCCPEQGLPVVQRAPLHDATPKTGVVLTDVDLPRSTNITDLEEWVEAVHG